MKVFQSILFIAFGLSSFALADEYTHYNGLRGTSPYFLHRSCTLNLEVNDLKHTASGSLEVGGSSYRFAEFGQVNGNTVTFNVQVMRDFGGDFTYRTFFGAALFTYVRDVKVVVMLADGQPTGFTLAQKSQSRADFPAAWVCENLK